MTSFNIIIDEFYHYIEHDIDFFNYFNLDEDECMEVAKQRSVVLLKEATSYLCRKLGEVDTYMYNDDSEFENELSYSEINLLVKTMFLCYLQRDLSTLRAFQGVMSSSDLNIYSPANERKTFNDMVKTFEEELKVEISEYSMIDRTTGMFKQICE